MTTPLIVPSYTGLIDLTAFPAARAVDLGPGGVGGLVTSLPGLLLGWSYREETGTAGAQVVLRDGTDNTGQRISDTGIASALSDSRSIAPPGVLFRDGLYADIRAGSVHGVVWVVLLGTGA